MAGRGRDTWVGGRNFRTRPLPRATSRDRRLTPPPPPPAAAPLPRHRASRLAAQLVGLRRRAPPPRRRLRRDGALSGPSPRASRRPLTASSPAPPGAGARAAARPLLVEPVALPARAVQGAGLGARGEARSRARTPVRRSSLALSLARAPAPVVMCRLVPRRGWPARARVCHVGASPRAGPAARPSRSTENCGFEWRYSG